MVNSMHTSGLFFASGHNSKRVTLPDITLESASSLNSISPSSDVPPLPSLNHLQVSMHEPSRNSYISVISNISDFVAGFSSPAAKQVVDNSFSPMASSVCLPASDRHSTINKFSIDQGYFPGVGSGTLSNRARLAFQKQVLNPLKSLYGFSLRLLAKAFKPIYQALLDGVQAVQTYKKHGATQVAELISNNHPTGKRDNLNFSCRGEGVAAEKSNDKPLEFKLLELNLSSTNLSTLFKSGEMPILP